MNRSLLIHIPHASLLIPSDAANSLLLTAEELRAEILCMTDWFTDELFSAPADLAETVAAPVSRLVVDVERFRDDAREPMAARGMGAVYTRTSRGLALRAELSAAERERWLARWYDPHHAALTAATERALTQAGRCLIVDAHSFPSEPLPYEADQDPVRPDICLGADPFHTPPQVLDGARSYWERLGFKVEVNRPFAGAITPLRYYGKTRAASSIMIEVNRALYMDETTGVRSENFQEMQDSLLGLFHELQRAGNS